MQADLKLLATTAKDLKKFTHEFIVTLKFQSQNGNRWDRGPHPLLLESSEL